MKLWNLLAVTLGITLCLVTGIRLTPGPLAEPTPPKDMQPPAVILIDEATAKAEIRTRMVEMCNRVSKDGPIWQRFCQTPENGSKSGFETILAQLPTPPPALPASVSGVCGTPFGSTIVASIAGQNFTACQWSQGGDVDGDGIADANVWGDPGWTAADVAANDFRLHPGSPAIDAGTMTGMPARTGIHNTLAGAHGLPNYTRLQTTNITSNPDIGAWEMLLKDGGFESGSMDGPAWFVKVRNSGKVCGPVLMTTTNPIFGSRSVVIQNSRCTEAPCISCRSNSIHQCFTGLEVGRTYSLSGTWSSLTGMLDPESAVDFGAFVTAACPDGDNCMQTVTCSAQVGAGGRIDFSCPNFFTATDSSMGIEIRGNVGGNAASTLALDNLELR